MKIMTIVFGLLIFIATNSYAENSEVYKAAWKQDVAKVEHLLKNGADVNSKGELGGYYMLHVAMFKSNMELFDCILKYNPDINAKNDDGQTPLHYAITFRETEMAIKLIDAGADIDVRNKKGRTPFQLASHLGNKEIADHITSKKEYWIERFSNDIHYAIENGRI